MYLLVHLCTPEVYYGHAYLDSRSSTGCLAAHASLTIHVYVFSRFVRTIFFQLHIFHHILGNSDSSAFMSSACMQYCKDKFYCHMIICS